MMGGKMDRVWYADVLLLFQASVQTGANHVSLRDFAFVQWFTSYGGPLDSTGGQRRHVDHAFPAILNRRFPRVYLMEPELGRLYDVIPIEDILAPAPIHNVCHWSSRLVFNLPTRSSCKARKEQLS